MFSPNKHSRCYLCSSTIGQALYSGTRKTENKNAVKKLSFLKSVTHFNKIIVSFYNNFKKWTSLVAPMVKNQPAMRESQVQSLGREDPLEKGMATHSSILAWRIPWTEELGRLQTMGLQRVGDD